MQDFATVIKTYAYYHTAAVVGIGVLLNLLIMAYQMHLCERELWLPRDAHTGLAPARFDDIDGARLLPLPPHHGEPVLFDAQGNAYYQSPYVSLLNAFYFIGAAPQAAPQARRDSRSGSKTARRADRLQWQSPIRIDLAAMSPASGAGTATTREADTTTGPLCWDRDWREERDWRTLLNGHTLRLSPSFVVCVVENGAMKMEGKSR